MDIRLEFPADQSAFVKKLLLDLAPHLLWARVIIIVLLMVGSKRIAEAFLNARKIAFGGFEIELKADMGAAAQAKNVSLLPQMQGQLARRAERLQPIVSGTRSLGIDDVPANTRPDTLLHLIFDALEP